MRTTAAAGLGAKFMEHTSSVYRWMTYRAKRLGRILPFTLGEYRRWLLGGVFKGSPEAIVQCGYCMGWLHGGNFVTDHEEPIARGGSLGLDNLVVACQECNQVKGRMSSQSFRSLLEFVQTLPPGDARDLLGRMKDGAAMVKVRAQERSCRKLVLPVDY